MKVVVTGLIGVILLVGSLILGFASVIEFIVYLVKDRPFDWWLVWVFVTAFPISWVFMFFYKLFESQEKQQKKREEIEACNQRRHGRSESGFAKRLREAQEAQKSK